MMYYVLCDGRCHGQAALAAAAAATITLATMNIADAEKQLMIFISVRHTYKPRGGHVIQRDGILNRYSASYVLNTIFRYIHNKTTCGLLCAPLTVTSGRTDRTDGRTDVVLLI